MCAVFFLSPFAIRDVGVVAQTMILAAAEKDLGGIMIGNYDAKKLAEVLDVNPRFLADDEILGAEGVMELLFELDEHYPISLVDCEDEDGNKRKGVVFGSILMTDLLSEWQRRKKDLADGKISKAEYTEWKLNWPKTTDDCVITCERRL